MLVFLYINSKNNCLFKIILVINMLIVKYCFLFGEKSRFSYRRYETPTVLHTILCEYLKIIMNVG